MKKKTLLLASTILIASLRPQAQAPQQLSDILREMRVELVQPGTISTSGFEFGTSLSPNGQELLFIKGVAGFRNTVLLYSTWKDGSWSIPEIAPFSGQHNDSNPYHSKDGKRLYFTSDRPSGNPKFQRTNLWYVDKTEEGWSQPQLMPGPLNDQYEIVYPTVQMDGTIHFVSWSRPGSEGGDIFVSELKDGQYTQPQRVAEVNTPRSDADPEISPDGQFMFLTSQRSGGLGHYDLYVFKKNKDGKWGEAIHLGPAINSASMDSDPILSPDGQTLYFSSDRLASQREEYADYSALVKSHHGIHNGLMNIYKVDITRLLDNLKNQ